MKADKVTLSVVWITGSGGLMLCAAIAWNASQGNAIDVSAGQLASTIFGGFLGYLTRAAVGPVAGSVSVDQAPETPKPPETSKS